MEESRLVLDRLVMLLAGEDNIREVIAFPKNSSAAGPNDKLQVKCQKTIR